MDRFWFLTTTTYGSWLPGDERGFVGPNRSPLGVQTIHNLPGTEYDRDVAWLRQYAVNQMTGPPIRFTRRHADALLCQFYETARHRRWNLSAVGIMTTHVHIVVGVFGDPHPKDILRDLKSYGSRALNRNFDGPQSDTWWTESGSKRKLRDAPAVLAAVEYIRHQPNPLLIWIAGENPPPVAGDAPSGSLGLGTNQGAHAPRSPK
jgi:REP element-mobilizing transposase RayT